MPNPTPPFLVFDESGAPEFYDSLDEIASDLEGVDVEDGLYEAFDSRGRIIHLKATGVERGRFLVDIGQTLVERVDDLPEGAERLWKLLFDHLQICGRDPAPNLDLAELIAAAERPRRRGG